MKTRPEILLHPNIPKPLHGLNPRSIMGQDWWDTERQAAYKRAEYCCLACGVSKQDAKYHQWLEAHELYDIDYAKGLMIFVEIVALCHSCHNYIHSGRMKILCNKGEMEEEKMFDILRHGNRIITEAKLKKPRHPKVVTAWKDWTLLFNGKGYKSKFESFEDWYDFYN